MDLNQRMQQYRRERKITQAEMAKACGLSPNYLSAMERGLYQPNAATLIKWAERCRVSIDELAGVTPEIPILPELKTLLESMPEDVQQKIYEMIRIAMR